MQKSEAAALLATLNLGSGVAETDELLESARVETSVFDDLLADRVDLIPGTKGSGKTALYRMFVDFLADLLINSRRVVIAHGVQHRQDTVFLAFKEQFDGLSEASFVDFWCVYLISLAYEQFARSDRHVLLLDNCQEELKDFRKKYQDARLPEFDRKKTLTEILAWALEVVRRLKVTWRLPQDAGQLEFSLENRIAATQKEADSEKALMPARVAGLTTSLEALLSKANLSLWLMVNRLDELFARRLNTEKKALRSLLRTLRLFSSDRIRIKIFLRDDILEQTARGFTAFSHVTARRADTLRWSEEQILAMIVRRIFASGKLCRKFGVDDRLLMSSVEYQRQLFYRIFSDTVHRPPNQSSTLSWIYNHTKDGRGVVTPRDVIFLLTRACQRQRDALRREPEGETERLVYGPAIIYGLEELSKEKRTVYLEAEFPHEWPDISKLVGGGTEYSENAMRRLFGRGYSQSIDDLVSLGIIEKSTHRGSLSF